MPVPPKCGGCQKQKAANAAALPDYRLRVVPPLCGECDERWIDGPTGAQHCPRCHPAEVGARERLAAMCKYHPEHPAGDCRACDVAREQYKRDLAANR